MNILVVGGSGYIGGAITDLLLETNHKVLVYDSLLYEDSYRKVVDFIYGDMRDTAKLKKYLDWSDVVIWLGALVGDGACALNPDVSVQINQNTVKWLSENYDKRIIFMSTCSVYGAQDGELNEDSPLNPLSVYAVTKANAERHLKDNNAIIFRLGTIFGVSDLFSRIRMDLVVNLLTLKAFMDNKLSVFGGDQFRPLLHVKDVARAVVANVDTDFTGVYNLHRQNVRIIDLAYQIRNHFPDVEMQVSEMQFQDTRNYRVSSDKAKNILKWKSIYSIDDGIDEVKELLENRRIKDVMNPRYTNQTFLKQFVPELEKIVY